MHNTRGVAARVRTKVTESALNNGLVGLMTTFMFFTTLACGSVTVTVRVCAYGSVLTVTLPKAQGRGARRIDVS